MSYLSTKVMNFSRSPSMNCTHLSTPLGITSPMRRDECRFLWLSISTGMSSSFEANTGNNLVMVPRSTLSEDRLGHVE